MPTQCSAALFEFAPVESCAVAAFDGGRITSDAGTPLLGAADRAIGLACRMAACFTDARRPDLIEHEVETLVMQRVAGVALGYEDLTDHDQFHRDPVMAPLAGKLAASTARIEAWFINLFLDAHAKLPRQITLDLDATDGPLHGHQEGRFCHGYYDCHCCLPLYIFWAASQLEMPDAKQAYRHGALPLS